MANSGRERIRVHLRHQTLGLSSAAQGRNRFGPRRKRATRGGHLSHISAIGLASDPQLAWGDACDRATRQLGSRVLFFPSIEAAVTEIGLLLFDRDRELGGTKNSIIYAEAHDSALDGFAKTVSAMGVEAKAKSKAAFGDVSSWLKKDAASALLLAFSESDRFLGEIRDFSGLRAARSADAPKLPFVVLSAESVSSSDQAPEPFEIRIYSIFSRAASSGASSSAVMAVLGDRIKIEPRLAPLSVSPQSLSDALAALKAAAASGSLDVSTAPSASATLLLARKKIETFEASLPRPFQPLWPVGASRLLDRAIFYSNEHDGSYVVDRLKENLRSILASDRIAEVTDRAVVVSDHAMTSGLFSLSGCAMNDERRQEWLRSLGHEPLKIRGTIHFSLALIDALSAAMVARGQQVHGDDFKKLFF